MTNLKMVSAELERNQGQGASRYYLPAVWNSFGFKEYMIDPDRPGEIRVEPYRYYRAAIRFIAAHARPAKAGEDNQVRTDEKTVGHQIMYGAFLRTLTAWNHDPGGPLESGTFLKTIALLPHLQSLGVEILYLLPIFVGGEKYKKGELGSPYAVKNYYQLDPTLHDPLLGTLTPSRLETEFKALIEACHLLGLRVMLDFVFRTAARDNDLIATHPEWFYWIGLEHVDTFTPPVIKRAKKLAIRSENKVELLYNSPDLKEYLAQFRPAPNIIDPVKWENLCAKQRQTGANILDLVEKEFNLTTTPGFSDVICDAQPPWTDATYLRFYFDLHPRARKYVAPEQPPYVLQDVACLNLYRGENPNWDLWQYIRNIVPYYQQKFGIDGARIDMGHALPSELTQAIIAQTRACDPNFIFWSEEFDVKNTRAAKADGYDLVTGDLWQLYKKVGEKGFCRHLFTRVRTAALPLTGALELPDTPRAAWYHPEQNRLESMVLLNYFLPNVVPFVNSGMELLEKQPMNLGLDNTEAGRFVLPATDPMYGKLAFFDRYRLHWLQEEQNFMVPLLRMAAVLRTRFCHLLKVNFLCKDCGRFPRKALLYFACWDERRGELLVYIANQKLGKQVTVTFGQLVPAKVRTKMDELTLVYAGRQLREERFSWRERQLLAPGEVVIAVGKGRV
mgnify:CR=1 FL=1